MFKKTPRRPPGQDHALVAQDQEPLVTELGSLEYSRPPCAVGVHGLTPYAAGG